MKRLDDNVEASVVSVLRNQKLFRYDCDDAKDSITAIFENQFATFVGSRYAIAMNSCSSALYVSLLCAGIKAGDKVAVPAFTFIAVPSAIVHAGAIPVLIEVTRDYVIDLEDFEKKLKEKNISALMLSYMRGRVPDIDVVLDICKKNNISLIEDAAHSLGVLYKGKQTGTFGLAGAYSAQSYKMIDGGEGGVLVTDDKLTAFKAMLYAGCYEENWRKHFWTNSEIKLLKQLTNTIPAFNFRMSNLSAAALIPQLANVDKHVEKLNKNYSRLCEILSNCKYIRIPDVLDSVRPAPDSMQWEFIGLDRQDILDIKEKLEKDNIQIDTFVDNNARCFWNWSFFDNEYSCDYTRRLIENSADLKLGYSLSVKDIERIGLKILKVVNDLN